MRAAIVVLALAGCRQVLGIPSGGTEAGFFIHVEPEGASGASGGAKVLVTHSESADTIVEEITDETTVLATALIDGESYEITPMGANCEVANGRGAIAGDDAIGVQIRCDGLASLGDFGFTAPITFEPDFDGTLDIANPLASIIVQQTGWEPRPRHDGTNIERVSYRGQIAGPGPYAFAEGNTFEVDLRNAGYSRTYTGDPLIAAPLPYGYGKPATTAAGARFGAAVAMFDRELVVGAANTVTVFARSGRDWVETQTLTGAAGERFGTSVALTADTLVIGAPGSSTVHVFARSGATWTLARSHVATNASTEFGTAVAIESANAILVGDPACLDTGCVYRFAGGAPAVVQRGRAGDRFGASLAVSGTRIVVGAPGDDSAIPGDPSNTQNPDAGAAWTFVLPGFGTEQYLKAAFPGVGDQFGAAVAIEMRHVAFIVVGAPFEDSGATGDPDDNTQTGAGMAFVFRLDGVWALAASVKSPNADVGDNFGHAVAIHSNRAGTEAPTCVIAIGAPFEDSGTSGDPADESAPDSGAVFVARLDASGRPIGTTYAKARNIGAFDAAGSALALTAETLVAGAPAEDSAKPGWNNPGDEGALDAGAVYTFR